MSAEATAKVGDLVAGKYRIERFIAQGGMGVVMAARHVALDQRVAVKLLVPAIAQQPEAVARFVREAQAAARIQSEHVGRVFDVGTLENGAPYMVMEYLEGADLSDELTRRGALPVAEAVAYMRQALDALCEAHELGIVHRDLKPSNLYLSRRPDGSRRVKVLDFGISKVDPKGGAAFQADLTSTQSTLGSPAYMSPEQVRSTKSVDVRTDIWSMGAILWELLTGKTLFDGETLGEIFSKIREDEIPRVSEMRPDVPVELERIVMRCLERRLDQRFASAADLARALAGFAGDAPPIAPPASHLFIASQAGRRSLHEEATTQVPALGITAPPEEDGIPQRDERVVHAGIGSQTGAGWAQGRATPSRGRVWVGVGAAVVIGIVVALYVGSGLRQPPVIAVGGEPSAAPRPATSATLPSTIVEVGSPVPVPSVTSGPTVPVVSVAPAPASAIPTAVPAPRATAPKTPKPPAPSTGDGDVLRDRH